MEKTRDQNTTIKARLFPSQRLLVCIILFMGDFIMQLMRNILSVGIVCMTIEESDTNHTNSSLHVLNTNWHTGSSIWLHKSQNSPDQLPAYSASDKCEGNLSDSQGYGETGVFDWSSDLQGVILSAFAYGYTAVMPFGGYIVTRFGGKHIIFLFMLTASVLTLLSPIGANASPYLFLALESVKGIFIAPYFPATYYIWSRWAVDEERTTLMNFAGTGGNMASIVGNILTGYICQYVGWEYIFYIYGGVSVAWCIVFYFTIWDKPNQNPRISEEELRYLDRELGDKGLAKEKIKLKEVPWRKILTCKTIWAVNIGGACWAFGSILQGRMIPSFLDDVLKLNIVENGLYSALPQICAVVVVLVSSFLSDYLIHKGLKVITVRKLMWGIGLLSAAVIGCFVGFLGCNQVTEAVLVMCLWVGMNSFAASGAYLTLLEHAPRYSALIMGFSNFIGNIPGVFTPSVIVALTPNGTQEEWKVTFFISGIVYIFGAFIFIILGEDGIAKWAKENEDNNDKTKDKIEESDKYQKVDESYNDNTRNSTSFTDSDNYIEKF